MNIEFHGHQSATTTALGIGHLMVFGVGEGTEGDIRVDYNLNRDH